MSPIHQSLFFTGIVQPMKESALTSPMDGVVEVMHYHYGQQVKKGQTVFTLHSAELQKQYNDILTDYLKAKDGYTVARAKFTGTKDLWKAGLISKNNYVSEKSSLNTMRITLMQANEKLTEMLKKTGNDAYKALSRLSFSEFGEVREALSGQHDLISIISPSDGVLLYPPKANDDKTGRITVGSAIKAGDVLGLVGDLRGIRVEIDVPEVDIDKIKTGMLATIRGVAFAKKELKGKLVTINAQASTGVSGALPSFSAIVEVSELDATAQAWIKVGMSASIELVFDSMDKLLIPIAAVVQDRGMSVVRIVNEKGSVTRRSVITGAVYGDKVIIDSGLKEGDVLTYE
jgi:multidrug efflux pump subunit AcrA (membrane-fusion protein)